MEAILELFSNLDWLAFIIAMVLVELTPGPNMGWLATISAQHGRRVGLMAVAGVTLGLACQVIAAATGLSSLISAYPFVYQALRWGGVGFMLWLAWEAFSDVGSVSPTKLNTQQGFRRGLVANLLNPKAFIFYIAIVGQFADPNLGRIWLQICVLGLLHLCVAVIVHIAIVLAGASLSQSFKNWSNSLFARLFFSLSLVVIAVWIAVSTN